jgi:hypothetical protein
VSCNHSPLASRIATWFRTRRAQTTTIPAVTILAVVLLFGKAININSEVESRQDAGVVEWIEVTEADGQDFIGTVDTKGQPGFSIANPSESQSVVGTSIGRFVVDGDAKFPEGSYLVEELRRSGRRYLCPEVIKSRLQCMLIQRGPTQRR